MANKKAVMWSPNGLGVRMQTLNSRVCGPNTDSGSIYSIEGVIPGLGFLKKPGGSLAITKAAQ